MKMLRTGLGLAALAGLAVALNVLILKEDFHEGLFALQVLLPLALALLCGLGWFVLKLVTVAGTFERGRVLRGLNTYFSGVVFLAICMILYTFARHWDRAWDLTQEGRQALAPQTVQVLENLTAEVTAVGLFNRGDPIVETAREKTQRFLTKCQKHTECLQVAFLDPQRDQAGMAALGLADAEAAVLGTVVLKCGGRQRPINLQGENPRLEERAFTNALVNVVRATEPKVYFLSGHKERDPYDDDGRRGGAQLNAVLRGESYQTERLALGFDSQEIPPDCDVLAVCDPRSDLPLAEREAIGRYLDRGGRLLVLLDRDYTDTRPLFPGLSAWLAKRCGVIVGEDMVISPYQDVQNQGRWDVVTLFPSATARTILHRLDIDAPDFAGCFADDHVITRAFAQQMYLPIARTVSLAPTLPSGAAGVEILYAMPGAWADEDLASLAKGEQPVRDEDETAENVSLAVAVVFPTDVEVGDTGTTQDARVVVIGDADFVGADALPLGGHRDFVLNAMAWLTESPELIAIRPTLKGDPAILLSSGDEKTIAWVAILGTVQLIILVGIVMYGVRRKYQ